MVAHRRPKPADFRDVYVTGGWSAVRARYGVGTPTITRWVDEEGRDALLAERALETARIRSLVHHFRRQASERGTLVGVPEPYAGMIRDEQRAERLTA